MDSSIQVLHSTPRSLHPLDSLVIQLTRLIEPDKVLEPLESVSDVHIGSGRVRTHVSRGGAQPGVDVAELGEKGQRIREVVTRAEFYELRET